MFYRYEKKKEKTLSVGYFKLVNTVLLCESGFDVQSCDPNLCQTDFTKFFLMFVGL